MELKIGVRAVMYVFRKDRLNSHKEIRNTHPPVSRAIVHMTLYQMFALGKFKARTQTNPR